MNTFFQKKKLITVLFAALILFSCSNRDSVERISFNMQQEATHQLSEVFKITGPEEGDYFNNFMKIDFLSNGNLIVLEMNATRFFEFSPDGQLLHVIGREGRGPGEFNLISSFVVTPEDSLHVYERNSARQHIFYKSGDEWRPVREAMSVPDIYNRQFAYDIPGKIHSYEDDHYVAQFKNTITPRDTTTKIYEFIAKTDTDLRLSGRFKFFRSVWNSAVYRIENRSSAADTRSDFQGSFYHFHPRTGNVILVHNNSNKIESLSENGELEALGRLPFEKFPIDMEKNKEWLELISDYPPEQLELIHSRFLPHEPFYNTILLDGDTLWVQLSREDKTLPNWIVTTLDGEILKVFYGPDGFGRIIVRDNRMYGVYHGLFFEPALAGYELTPID